MSLPLRVGVGKESSGVGKKRPGDPLFVVKKKREKKEIPGDTWRYILKRGKESSAELRRHELQQKEKKKGGSSSNSNSNSKEKGLIMKVLKCPTHFNLHGIKLGVKTTKGLDDLTKKRLLKKRLEALKQESKKEYRLADINKRIKLEYSRPPGYCRQERSERGISKRIIPPQEVIKKYPGHYNQRPPSVINSAKRGLLVDVLKYAQHEFCEGFPTMEEEAISAQEVLGVIRRFAKRDTAAGLTGSTYRGIAAECKKDPGFCNKMTVAFEGFRQQCLNLDRTDGIMDKIDPNNFPPEVIMAKLVLLAKKDPGSEDPSHWRPITLMQPECKLLVAILNDRIIRFLTRPIDNGPGAEARRYIRYGSEGYLPTAIGPGATLEMPLRIVRQGIEAAMKNKAAVTVIFADITNAFGSIPMELVFSAMEAIGLSRDVISMATYLVQNGKVQLEDLVYEVVVGVFQGSPASGTIYSEVASVPIVSSRPEIDSGLAVTYYDDLAGLFTGNDGSTSRTRANEWLDRAEYFLTELFNLEINLTKSAVLCYDFSRPGNGLVTLAEWKRAPVELWNRGRTIKTPLPLIHPSGGVESVNYLGVAVVSRTRTQLLKDGPFSMKAMKGEIDPLVVVLERAINAAVKEKAAHCPVLVKVVAINEVLPKFFAIEAHLNLMTEKNLAECEARVRSTVRKMIRGLPGVKGNPLPAWLLHRRRCLLGLGLTSIRVLQMNALILSAGRLALLPSSDNSNSIHPAAREVSTSFQHVVRALAKFQDDSKWIVKDNIVKDIVKDAQFPTIRHTSMHRIIPPSLLDQSVNNGIQITKQGMATLAGENQMLGPLSACVTVGLKVELGRGDTPPSFQFDGEKEHITDLKGLKAALKQKKAKWAHPAGKVRAKPGQLAMNAVKGRVCVSDPSFNTIHGLTLLLQAELTLVAPILNQPKQGKYIWRRNGESPDQVRLRAKRQGRSKHHPTCNACGKSGKNVGDAVHHVFGGDSKHGCQATRLVLLHRHDSTYVSFCRALVSSLKRRGDDKFVTVFEKPASSTWSGMTLNPGSIIYTKRVDPFIHTGMELIIVECSVCTNDQTTNKEKQVQEYARLSREANSVPKVGSKLFPKKIWRRVGKGAILVKVVPAKYDGVNVIIAEAARQSLVVGCSIVKHQAEGIRAAWQEWVSPVLKDHEQWRKDKYKGQTRLVVLTTPAFEAKVRKCLAAERVDATQAVIPIECEKALKNPFTEMTWLGCDAREKALEFGVQWPPNAHCPMRPNGNGIVLHVGTVTALFDQMGTAYPSTVKGFRKWTGQPLPRRVGAVTLRSFTTVLRAWKSRTAANRRHGRIVYCP